MDSLDTKNKGNKECELGQYFTPRKNNISIIELRKNLLDLSETINIISIPSGTFTHTMNNTMNTKENDLIKTILDPFGGTGGFSTMNK